MNKPATLFALIAPLLIASAACTGRTAGTDATVNPTRQTDSTAIVTPVYAKGFHVTQQPGGITLLDINDPENVRREQFHFALVEDGATGDIPEGYQAVRIPVERVVCMTSLQLSNFLKLGIPERVVGITSTRHLKSPVMHRQLESGLTSRIGIEGNFDNEILMALDPDLMLISPFKRGGYEALKNTDIPMMPHLGYKELTPLGQAEWIKVVGLLTGHAAEANEIFAGIENRYNSLKAMADTASQRPTVFSGEIRSGNWYAVGGRSFLAQLFRDAGADYFLRDNNESGGVTLDYETVYASAADADYWRIVNSFDGEFDYDALRTLDERYTDFRAWRDHGVIYCNMTEVPYYESMPVEPEEVLADFIHVFHPGLLPDHKPVYYHLMK